MKDACLLVSSNTRSLMYGIGIGILLSSCLNRTDFGELEIDEVSPHLALPLLHGFVTTNELIEKLQEQNNVIVNTDGIYAVQFFAEPFIQTKEDVFPKVTLGLPIPIFDSVAALPLSSFQEATLSRATLKGDNIFFILNSDQQEDIAVNIRIPNLSRNGEVFSYDYVIPFSGESISSFTTPSISLADYHLEALDGQVSLVYDARKLDGTRVRLALSFASVNAFDFSYIEGQIGQTIVPTGLQSIAIAIDDTLVDGTYQFEDPKIHFDVTNSFGIPVGIQVKELFLVNKLGVGTPIVSPLFDEIIILSFPTLDQVGEAVVDRITFDKTNSNILELIENDIKEIRYNLDILTNPNQDESEFFLTDSSAAIIEATVDLSFAATIEMVSAQQNAAVSLADIDTLSSARIKVFVDNAIPLSFFPELTFFQKSGVELLLQSEGPASITSANTDADGNVTGNVVSAIYYPLDAEQISSLAMMDSVEAKLTIQSPQNGVDPTVIRPGQVLKFGVGIEARIK